MRLARLFPLGALLLAAACGLAEDEQDDKNKHIYLTISDPAFETYCLEEFDTDRNGRLSRYEAQRVLEMDCSVRGIASLGEIGEFRRLQRLDCSGNALAQLDLRDCTLLQQLDCADNRLLALDLNGLRSLTALDCSGNLLPRLSLGSNASLLRLDCSRNALTGTLDLSACDARLQADVRTNPDLATVYCLPTQHVDFDGATERADR